MNTCYQKIVPHLWFHQDASKAAQFYTSIFPNSHMNGTVDADIVSFNIAGQHFIASNGRRNSSFNTSISFFIHFEDESAHEKIANIWRRLAENGKVLMPLEAYPFSEKYGWIQDKFGISWQLMLAEEKHSHTVPSFMFTGNMYGKAEEAIQFYVSVFHNSHLKNITHYPSGMEPDVKGNVMYADFSLEKQTFAMMESAQAQPEQFNEAISFIVYCDTQDEIDYLWDKLSYFPEREQSGWLKDKYGVSWQLIPKQMEEMMANGTKEQITRVVNAVHKMKKISLDSLWSAFYGE